MHFGMTKDDSEYEVVAIPLVSSGVELRFDCVHPERGREGEIFCAIRKLQLEDGEAAISARDRTILTLGN